MTIVGIFGVGYWIYYSGWETVHNNPDILRIRNSKIGSGVSVGVPNEDSIFRIVDMSVFNGFRTGFDFSNALKVYGLPDNKGEKNGIQFLEYWRPNGRVQIVRQETTSGISWHLYAYPNAMRYDQFFVADIASRIKPSKETLVDLSTKKTSLLMCAFIGASGFSVGFFIERDRGRVLRGGRTRHS